MILGIVVHVTLARLMGVENFGIYNYCLAIGGFAVLISRAGFENYMVKELIAKSDFYTEILKSGLCYLSIMSLVVFFLALIYLYLMESDPNIFSYNIIVLLPVFFSPFFIFDYYFQSAIEGKKSAVARIVSFYVGSFLKIVVYYSTSSILALLFVILFESIIYAGILLWNGRCLIAPIVKAKYDSKWIKDTAKTTLPLLLTAISMMGCIRLDQLMIKNFLGMESLGIYSAASRLFEAWTTIPFIITTVFYPIILNYKKFENESYFMNMVFLTRTVFYMTIIAILIFFYFGDEFILFLYGEDFNEVHSVLLMLLISALFVSLGSITTKYLVAEGMEKRLMYRVAIGLLINFILNYFLIPFYELRGAVFSSIVSFFFSYFLYDYLDRKSIELRIIKRKAILGV
ncbi:O-unit flippase [Marinobacterium zhoushanense]|uniref:O-unit flippase n=1 Tax=Marinobacterium zhoushanense TaxID=1679163 RepID=A0ABQ1KTZ9_9GAMM|nr:O-unit flippase [Marinobacterium zhoushanense]